MNITDKTPEQKDASQLSRVVRSLRARDKLNQYQRSYYHRRKNDEDYMDRLRAKKRKYAKKLHEKNKDNPEYKKMKSENAKNWRLNKNKPAN